MISYVPYKTLHLRQPLCVIMFLLLRNCLVLSVIIFSVLNTGCLDIFCLMVYMIHW